MENSDFVQAGNGTLYKNDKKTKDTHADYQGPITVIDKDGSERKMRVSAWKTPDKDYEMSFKISFKKEEEAAPF